MTVEAFCPVRGGCAILFCLRGETCRCGILLYGCALRTKHAVESPGQCCAYLAHVRVLDGGMEICASVFAVCLRMS